MELLEDEATNAVYTARSLHRPPPISNRAKDIFELPAGSTGAVLLAAYPYNREV